MRAIFTAFPQQAARVMLLKTGSLTHRFRDGQRLFITDVPPHLRELPAGELPEVRQMLATESELASFFQSERVIMRAGGREALKRYTDKIPGCQSVEGDHNTNLVTSMTKGGDVLRLCWSCDNVHYLRGYRELAETAAQNRREWILDYVRLSLRLPEGHQVTLPELFCWAVMNDAVSEFPVDIVNHFYSLPNDEVLSGTMKEADISPWSISARQLVDKKAGEGIAAVPPDMHPVVEEQSLIKTDGRLNKAVRKVVKPALRLAVDEDPPAGHMRKPKMLRLELPEYTQWVKCQPCCGCGQTADDPHHLINHGFGGTGTKACDLLIIPLCRVCHNQLHADTNEWEKQHGSQLLWLARTLNRASGIGAIARA